MSYVDQGMTRGRVYAIIGVAVLHALLAYAVVTGLAYNFMKKAAEDLKTFDVQEEPPPPPEPPPPEQPQVQPPPIVSPPPMVRMNDAGAAGLLGAERAAAGDHADRAAGSAGAARAAAAAAAGRAGARPGESRFLYLGLGLSGFRDPRRTAGNDRLPPDRRNRRPGDRLHGHLVERLLGSRRRRLPDHAKPRTVHAGPRRSWQSHHRFGQQPHPVGASGGLIMAVRVFNNI